MCAATLLSASGCSLIPEVVHQPVVHNPFPQLSRVAVAPFFNLSTEPSVDGRQFALAYFNELQSIPGFEVVSMGVVEQTIRQYHLEMTNASDARRLAQILGVDAVVIGAVTDYSPYYPPRCGLSVEWYAASPCYHPIPAGYGLPWGTCEEEFIPAPLVFEAEMELARAQMKVAATPPFSPPPMPSAAPPIEEPEMMPSADPLAQPVPQGEPASHKVKSLSKSQHLQYPKSSVAKPQLHAGKLATKSAAAAAKETGGTAYATDLSDSSATRGTEEKVRQAGGDIADSEALPQGPPANWPDARSFIPAAPCDPPNACLPTNDPVMKHTRIYNGNDGEFTAALANYVFFQDDARRGGWQAYLQRSDDFIRFCCRLHLYEMLSARGGAGETRVVWKWPTDR
jgi:hypothetical protein